jgi:hypothetical protein
METVGREGRSDATAAAHCTEARLLIDSRRHVAFLQAHVAQCKTVHVWQPDAYSL